MPPYAVTEPFRRHVPPNDPLIYQTYRYKWSYNKPLTSFLTRLKKYELMIYRYDECWGGMTTHQQTQCIEECANAMRVNHLLTLPYHFVQVEHDGRTFTSDYHLSIFDTPSDAMQFKLKWPGKIIGANK